MHTKIKQYLARIEKERNIKILLACETGSRAWGFPSPDSDYDIRMLYVHPENWYLSLNERKDTLELMFENNDLDITGWDVRKSLRLLKKSNPPLLERIQSPILYKSDPAFLEPFTQLAQQAYSRIATMYHYLNMSIKCYEEIKGKEAYKLKKFFYALRTATVCKWILEKEEMPPIEFHKVLAGLQLDASLTERIQELIALKATISESYLHEGEGELFAFIEECQVEAKAKSKELPAGNVDAEEMNVFFRKTVRSSWT